VSNRIVLDPVLRQRDGNKVTEEHIRHLRTGSNAAAPTTNPFVLARILPQDLTLSGPADLAAMRASPHVARSQGVRDRRTRGSWITIQIDHKE